MVLNSFLYKVLVLAVGRQCWCDTQVSKGGRVQDVAGGVAVAAMAEEEEGTAVPMLTLVLVTTTKVQSVHKKQGPLERALCLDYGLRDECNLLIATAPVKCLCLLPMYMPMLTANASCSFHLAQVQTNHTGGCKASDALHQNESIMLSMAE